MVQCGDISFPKLWKLDQFVDWLCFFVLFSTSLNYCISQSSAGGGVREKGGGVTMWLWEKQTKKSQQSGNPLHRLCVREPAGRQRAHVNITAVVHCVCVKWSWIQQHVNWFFMVFTDPQSFSCYCFIYVWVFWTFWFSVSDFSCEIVSDLNLIYTPWCL